ncbi:MAG: DUF3306 domain-containing protein [Gammaproteobacteria bacterium]|nr:DUF3306 domain-containing protein [Gammaproteobacteria bacterium]MDH5800405.1 DUF3306 domain-containing protein [Gammaproteobacteria bacterium]
MKDVPQSDIDPPDDVEEDFLRRWSRRKSHHQQLTPKEPLPTKANAGLRASTDIHAAEVSSGEPALSALSQSELSQSELSQSELPEEPSDADMPDIESLGEHSDYSGFMSPKVSEPLRRRALRKLFAMPVFNVTDGLNDYDEDYTQFAPLGDVIPWEMRERLRFESKRKEDEAKSQEQEAKIRDEETREDPADEDREELQDPVELLAPSVSEDDVDPVNKVELIQKTDA